MRNFTKTLKTLVLMASMILVLVTLGFAQQTMLLTESFETGSGTTPPAGWSIEQVTGTTLGVSFVTTGTFPTIAAAYDGTKFVQYNSHNIASGATRMKRTTSVSTTNKSFIMVDFAWYEDPASPASTDMVDVQWSTNGTTWNTAGTFNRYNAAAGWKVKNVVLPAGANNQATLYVAFQFSSGNGNNCSMDLVHVTAGPAAPPAFVTIGTGTVSSNYPYTTYWMGGRTQMLITAAELTAAGAGAGNLSTVGFDVITNSTQVMNGFNLKMGATTLTSLTGGYVNGLTAYYTTPYAVPGTGWQNITLTTPFAWNGTSNLIVEICYANTSYTSYSPVRGTAMAGMTAGHYGDNQTECSVATNSAPAARPNIRFGVPPITPGVLMGYVRDVNTLAPIAGAIIQVGSARDTSRANGMYILYNLNAGAVTVNSVSPGYISGSVPATIVGGAATNLDILMSPGPKVGGMVTNASTGAPVTGAAVTIGTGSGALTVLTTGDGSYLSPLLSISGDQPIEIGKTGFDSFTGTVTLVPNTTATQDAALLATAVQPGPFTAALNNPTTPTAVNLNWGIPQSMYQVLYDDGTQDNFAIWVNANNLNALKITPLGWPVKLIGGKVYLGAAGNYPPNALPLTKFMMLAYKANGAGGLPGTVIDSVEVTPLGFGWADFSFSAPITISTGDFYLAMRQGGVQPHAAGLGVDLTNTQLRSYSKFVTGGAGWIPAAGNFMIRAIMQGTGGPLLADNSTTNRELITATAVNGLIYETPVVSVTGYEGVARTEPFEWSTMQNTNAAPQIAIVPVGMQPATDPGAGSNIMGTVIPTDAPLSVLFDNGSMVTSTGTGFGGADESMLQSPLTSYGSNINHAVYYRIADDFSVSGSPWDVSSVEFYSYQTGSSLTSPITGAYCRILSGTPGQPGTTVVWGDTTTNRMTSTSFSNIYRVNVTGNNQRPIMKIVVNTPGLSLPTGNYWIEFAAIGSASFSGPWCPYVTINNTPTTGNGLLYTGTTGGYIPVNATFNQGIPFKINGTQTSPGSMSYQVWRLLQGQEGTQASWTSIWTGGVNSATDTGWPTLANGPYRWAVKAIYSPPGQRPSAPTFSNVIGKGWTANVNVCVSLTCAANPKEGTMVKLINADLPDTTYTKITDATGCVHFTNVWKGSYQMTITRFTYPIHTETVAIMGDATINVTLLQETAPPTNLVVNDQTLKATWSPPRSTVVQLDETFTTGGFTTNQWVVTGGTNWQMSATGGNPAPSAMFNWTPEVYNYDQYLTSKSLAGIHAPQMKLKYDMFLDNFGNTFMNTLAVEIWNGTTWTVLKTYDNMSGEDIPWTSETLDITSQTHNPDFKIRFHAAGEDTYDIMNWKLDNIKVVSTDGSSGPNPCVLGYNFYLNNVLSTFTTDTTYNIPPNQVVYGQTYEACVLAVYGSGYSPQICVTFTSHFLYPARDLTATGIECNTYLTWKKPVTLADNPEILGMTPRTEFPNNHAEFSPYILTVKEQPKNNDNSEALWDVLFGWAASGTGQAGVEMAGDFIYATSWSAGPPWFFKYDATGNLIESFSIPGVSAIRDIAYDGTQYMYGGSNASSIYKMDFATKTLVATIPTSISAVRHIAYDAENNGLWVGGWSDLFLVNIETGATIATGPAVESVYGSAWENQTTGGPYLWLHSQTASGTDDEFQKWKITGTTVANTGISHLNSGGSIDGPAGGLGCGKVGTKLALIGLNQADAASWIWATEIGDWQGGGGGGTPAGLIGYNIYRGGTFLHYNAHPDSVTYYDYGLDPGIYKYDVKARYDLTSYGFPGQFGESLGNTAGEKTVTLNCGRPLPFYEPWTGGSFGFNGWQADAGHWSINTGIGNTAPSADFTWQPAITNYSQAFTSDVINASPWNCAKIWLDFDVKLVDRNNTGKEKLTVDLFYAGTWHQKVELTNTGSTSWVLKHLDISAVKGKSFRVRFVAHGVNSADILHWYVDNIHAYGICNAATAFSATQSHFITTLTWTAPECVGTVPTQLKKLFQWSGTPDNAYYQSYNNAYGVVYDLAAYPEAALNKIDFHHASWGTSGTWQYKIHVVDWTTYAEIATLGPLTTTGNDIWENNVPLGTIPGVGGKLIGIMLEPLSNSATDAYPDFSADNTGPDGVSVNGALPDYSAFGTSSVGDFLQNLWIEIPADDKMELVQARKVNVNALQTLTNTRSAATSPNTTGFLTTNQSVYTDNVIVSDSSVITGYNVYRTASTGVAPYLKLNSSLLTATTYVDTYPSSLVSGTFRYYVKVVYKNSEDNEILCEPSSDTLLIAFPHVGFNELSKGEIMIYPNPATEVLNIKSDYTITGVEVMNFVGQKVYSNSNVGSKTGQVNVTGFKPGVYVVKVSTTEGIRTVKITVTH